VGKELKLAIYSASMETNPHSDPLQPFVIAKFKEITTQTPGMKYATLTTRKSLYQLFCNKKQVKPNDLPS
jgi:hypothetical protein